MGNNKSQEKRKNQIVLKPNALKAMNDNCCPVCGLHRDSWSRRKDWNCCSTNCTRLFYKNCVIATSWQDMRFQIFKRDNETCQLCGVKASWSFFDCDHKQPIAAGGEMWDKDNLQTLCESCHKIKTKSDRVVIKNYASPEDIKRLLREVEEDGYAVRRPYES